MNKSVSIIIPVYTSSITREEWLSIDRCFDLMSSRYEIIMVMPESLDCQPFNLRYKDSFRVERFDDSYFSSIAGYNRLMLSSDFYQRFLYQQYILIYQADCYLFDDNLDFWCEQGYDYIGAPWINKSYYTKPYYRLFTHIKQLLSPRYSFERLKLQVGNGGLSLRHTSRFHTLSVELRSRIEFYLSQANNSLFNEDVFWSIEANRDRRRLRMPSYRVAIGFAFDNFPNVAYELSQGVLPMGCHGWTKESCREFYQDKIKIS